MHTARYNFHNVRAFALIDSAREHNECWQVVNIDLFISAITLFQKLDKKPGL